jgi:hypothetical protein
MINSKIFRLHYTALRYPWYFKKYSSSKLKTALDYYIFFLNKKK